MALDKVQFNQRWKMPAADKLTTLDFHPGVIYGFEDPDALPFFKAVGCASKATGDVAVTITLDELDIDPLTLWGQNEGDKAGKFVMPDRAAAHLEVDVAKTEAYRFTGVTLDQFNAHVGAELKGNENG